MPIKRGDLLLVRRAARERWPVSTEVGAEVMNRMLEILVDPDSNSRLALNGCRTVVVIEQENMRLERLLRRLRRRNRL